MNNDEETIATDEEIVEGDMGEETTPKKVMSTDGEEMEEETETPEEEVSE